MRFARYYELGKTQPELDFIDVELNEDTPLFLDPYTIGLRPDDWSIGCATNITLFFDTLLDAVRREDDGLAWELLGSLHEPNETRLGLSKGSPQGNAIGTKLAGEMLRSLKGSEAVRTGLLRELADGELFVEGIGHDRISDLVTNVLRAELIEYTQVQCHLHDIELRGTVASGPMWNPATLAWYDDLVQLPVVNGRKVLLVPKWLVRWTPLVTPADYYDHFVLNFLQEQAMRGGVPGLVHTLSGRRRKVTKKELREAHPYSKAYLRTFSQEHPEVLEEYKRLRAETGANPEDLSSEVIDERVFAAALIRALTAIPPGPDDATKYHRLMIGLLEFVFFPDLLYPQKENEINEGRKRIDIVYTNGARDGLFSRFPRMTRKPALRIMVECKNYSTDPANPEVDQIAGRFAPHRGWLGLLVFRTVDDLGTLVARCRDTAAADRGYVIPLADRDIIAMLEAIAEGQRPYVDRIVSARFGELTR